MPTGTKQVVIVALPAVAQRLADRLHAYFNTKKEPCDGGECHMDIVFYEDDGKRRQERVCTFASDEEMSFVMQMFWLGYKRLFPEDAMGNRSYSVSRF